MTRACGITIGDVRDRDSVERAMHGVQSVFHAAALKQVPICEFFPMEAVRTNIDGSENVIARGYRQQGRQSGVPSTDKAVFPINAMGMSKAMMEKPAQSVAREIGPKARDDDQLCALRQCACIRAGR